MQGARRPHGLDQPPEEFVCIHAGFPLQPQRWHQRRDRKEDAGLIQRDLAIVVARVGRVLPTPLGVENSRFSACTPPLTLMRRLRHHDDRADLTHGLAKGHQRIRGAALADAQLNRVPGVFHGYIPDPLRSPWLGWA